MSQGLWSPGNTTRRHKESMDMVDDHFEEFFKKVENKNIGQKHYNIASPRNNDMFVIKFNDKSQIQ